MAEEQNKTKTEPEILGQTTPGKTGYKQTFDEWSESPIEITVSEPGNSESEPEEPNTKEKERAKKPIETKSLETEVKKDNTWIWLLVAICLIIIIYIIQNWDEITRRKSTGE